MPSSSCDFSSASWIWFTQGSSIGVEKIAAIFIFSCAAAGATLERRGDEAGGGEATKARRSSAAIVVPDFDSDICPSCWTPRRRTAVGRLFQRP